MPLVIEVNSSAEQSPVLLSMQIIKNEKPAFIYKEGEDYVSDHVCDEQISLKSIPYTPRNRHNPFLVD